MFDLVMQLRMKDPVIAADGLTYERAALEQWLASLGALKPRSPVTGELLAHTHLLPNLAMRALLEPQ